MDRDLFLAILSMDSYNRGYDQGIKPAKISGSQIGNATISQTSAVLGQEGGERRDESVGFFGIAYSWGDETIISYRGSDKIAGFSENLLQFLGVLPAGDNDVINGYGVAAGYPNGPQAKLAIEFYRQVAGGDVNPETRTTSISVTGHSLGAGLSGLIAGLYHLDGTHFDPMPFGAALATADFWGFLPPTVEAAEFVGLAFGGETPWLSLITPGSQAYAIASNGIRSHNQLDWARNQFGLNTGINVDYLSLPPDVPFSITDRNGVGQAHANNLIVMTMFGNGLGLGNLNWKSVAKYFIPALFDEKIGLAAGGDDIDNTPIVSGDPSKHDYSGAMRDAIAYSALDEGSLIFGNVGIRALFNDANELGEVLVGTHSSTISDSAESIARIFTQFAGRMAIAKVAGDNEALHGVVSIGADTVSIDLSMPLWRKGEGVLPFEGEIVGRRELLSKALSQLQTSHVYMPVSADNPTMVPVPNYSSDLLAGLRILYGDHTLFDPADPTRVVDRVVFQRTDTAFAGTLLPRWTQAPDSGVTLFAMGGGNDQVDGSSDSELIYGGDGIDIIRGGLGDDLIAGGTGNDVLSGGAGRDFLAGGEGEDRIDLELDPESATGVGLGLTAVDPPREGEQSYFAFSLGGAQSDYANGIEIMWLSSKDDTVIVTSLGDPDARSAMADLKVDFKGSGTPALNQDTVDLSGVAIDNYDPYGFFSREADLGVYVDLSNSTNQEVRYLYDYFEGNNPWIVDWLNFYQLGTVVGDEVKLKLANANTAIGTDNDDYLIGNGGKKADGEGYSTLIGGGGNDLFKGAGWETHIWGGEGSDIVSVGIGGVTVFEDADMNDRTRFGLVPLFGGVQAWWNETGTATWAPMSSLMAAFPFVSAQAFFSIAAMAIDGVTMKFAKYRHDAETGDLIVDLGWGLGGSLIIKDYDIDLNTGRGDAGITVFRQGKVKQGVNSAIKASNGIEQYVNLALYAGFGMGLSGFDPLVLDLDDNGYDLISREYSRAYFEFDGDGFAENAGWIGGNDAFLVRDINGNGRIDDITEMFGNRTTSGFTALAALDSNSDGVFNSADTAFATVKLWKDANSDGVTDAGELISLADAGIVSISLTATTLPDTDVRGNVIVREGSFTRGDGTIGKVGDVALDVSDTDTRWTGAQTPSQAAAALPQIAGIGQLVSLRLAMTGDATLLSMVNGFAGNSSASVGTLRGQVEDILYRWAGVDGVAATAIGTGGFDTRKLAFLEKYVGIQLMPRGSGGAVQTANLAQVEALWSHEFNQISFKLLVQGPLAAKFTGLTYYETHDLLRAGNADTISTILSGFLDDMPAGVAAAADYWADWGPLLGAFAGVVMRTSGVDVGRDYFFAELVKAVDIRSLPLNLETLAAGLAIDGLKIGGVSALTRTASDSGTLTYYSETGSQHFVGGSGQDAYVFGHAIGNAVINDSEGGQSGDRIRFAFLTPDDVTMARDGNDLLITVIATGETVRVVGQYAPVVPQGVDIFLSSNKGVEDIQFADGTIYENSDMAVAVGKGTSGNDQLTGTMHSDVLQGLAGDDILMGGDDADIYVVNGGEGDDIIREVQSTVLLRSADVLILGENIAPDEVEFFREGSGFDDLRITFGTGGSVVIENQFSYSTLGYNSPLAPNSRIEVVSFRHYGQSWSNKDIENLLIQRATTAGNDVARGFGSDDYFITSAGDDVLIGMDGGDIYEFGRGSGNDTIDEQSRYINVTVGLGGLANSVENDVVRFKGLTLADVTFTRLTSAPDLTITINATGETLTVKGQFDGFQTGFFAAQWLHRIEKFEFADGSALNWQQVAAMITTGGDGNDQLWGDLYTDRMVGGKGNDTLSGGGKADEYVFNLGDGQDVLFDNNRFILGDGILNVDNSPDYVSLGVGITAEMVTLGRNGGDLILNIGTDGDRITLKDQNNLLHTGVFGVWGPSRIEEIRFASGTVWTWQGLNARWIADNTTSGNDVVSGFSLEDIFEASAGNDILSGGDSGDVYRFGLGSGQDIIRESVDNVMYGDSDSVEFAAGLTPEDVQLSRVGSNLVVSLSDGSSLTIEGQFSYLAWYSWQDIELFKFSNGVTWTAADIRAHFLTSTTGNDTITGFDDDDVIDGGAGNDILRGGNGSDTYHFGIGSGHDIIEENRTNTNLSEADRVVFGAGLLPENVTVAREDDDLILTIISTGETLTLKGQFAFANWYAWWDVERFEFADGTVWTDRDIAVRLTGGTPGDDTINGTFRSDTLDGGAGNDILLGGDGSDIYVFGRGYGHDEIRETLSNANLDENDELRFGPGITLQDLGFARDGNDLTITILDTAETLKITGQFAYSNWYTWWDVDQFRFDDGTTLSRIDVQQLLLQPAAGDQHMIGFMTGDRIDGGAGNDILEGGDGADTYVFGRGYGQDEIRETMINANLSENDTLEFASGVSWDDLIFSRSGNTLTIGIEGTSDTLTIDGQWSTINDTSTHTWWDVENFVFADGTTKTRADIQTELTRGTDGADTIDDFYTNDTLIGGLGNDILRGSRGADTFVHNAGDGHDIVSDYTNFWGSTGDRILFGAGIAPGDVTVGVSPDNPADMLLSVNGGQSSVTLKNQVGASDEWEIDNVEFADGTIWSAFELSRRFVESMVTPGDDIINGTGRADTINGGSGNDVISGRGGNDIIAGGVGNDLLRGEAGNDVYVYALGDGDDVIDDLNGQNAVQLGAGIAPGDIYFSASASSLNDIVIRFTGNLGSITLTNQLNASSANGAQSLSFADGTVWDRARILAEYLARQGTAGDDYVGGDNAANILNGGGGNDTIRAQGGDDQLTGATGNDRLEGGSGNDSYYYAFGDGNDVIADGGNDTIDKLVFGSGIAQADVLIDPDQNNAANIIIRFVGRPETILVEQQLTGSKGLERIEFADGSFWGSTEIANQLALGVVRAGNETINGTSGADTLNGFGGNDAIYGGGGNDILIGGIGNDSLFGQGGNDTYLFDLGDGQDVIYESESQFGSGGTETLRFGLGITLQDLVLSKSMTDWNDLRIAIAGTTDSILIDNQDVSYQGRYYNRIENFVFQTQEPDGSITQTTVGWQALEALRIAGAKTSGADVIIGGTVADTIDGAAGNDTLYGWTGNDTLIGGLGNDYLRGDSGSDTYVFNLGDGQDTIFEAESQHELGGSETLRFGLGITLTDLVLSKTTADWNDLTIGIAGTTDSILIDGQDVSYQGRYYNRIENFVFQVQEPGGSITQTTVGWQALEVHRIAQNKTSGNDVIIGSTVSDTIEGGAGNDTLYGWSGNDTIIGGIGNDYLRGDTGNDTYVFNLGDGQDTIFEAESEFEVGGTETLRFGLGITLADLVLSKTTADWNDLRMGIVGTTDTILIDNQDVSYQGRFYNRIENFVFQTQEPGGSITETTVGWQALEAHRIAQAKTSGGDVIIGSTVADTIDGGAGNDTLNGWTGDDILIGGEGNDTLDGGAGTDTALLSGLRVNYSLVTSGGKLNVSDNAPAVDGDDGTDSLKAVEKLKFSDGEEVGITSPIILDLDGGGVSTLSASISNARYDMDGDGFADDTSWMGSGEGMLFLDRDGNGTLSNAGEFSFVADVEGAASDLVGLRAFDSNGDGTLSSADDRFADFRIWRDGDGNGVVGQGEILSLTGAGVQSLGLAGTAVNASVAFGDVVTINTGSFTRTDGTSAMFIDAALTYFAGSSEASSFAERHARPMFRRQFDGLAGDGLRGGSTREFHVERRYLDDPIAHWPKLDDRSWRPGPSALPIDTLDDVSVPQSPSPASIVDRQLAMMVQEMSVFGAQSAGEGLQPWQRENVRPMDFFA